MIKVEGAAKIIDLEKVVALKFVLSALGLGPMCPTRKHPGKLIPEITAGGTEKCKEKRFDLKFF